MTFAKQVRKLNDLIGRELGRNTFQDPIYKWMHSEDLALRHPMRVDGYDYKADPRSGLIVAHPKYELRKLAFWLDDQWVICMWEAPIPESQWREMFGYGMEWPKRGTYYPTNVDLDRGVVPNQTLTDVFIQCVKQQRQKTYADHYADGERALERSERATDNHIYDVVRDSCTAFANVPGRKMHVSFPAPRYQIISPADA